jgi:hypothetical protein
LLLLFLSFGFFRRLFGLLELRDQFLDFLVVLETMSQNIFIFVTDGGAKMGAGKTMSLLSATFRRGKCLFGKQS